MEFKLTVDIESHKNEITKAMLAQAKLGLKAVGEVAAGYARENCPVDTGLLRNSIASGLAGELPSTQGGGHSYSDNANAQKGGYVGRLPADIGGTLTVYIGSNVEYAAAVEYRDIEHRVGKAHFLRDAITENIEEYQEILTAALTAGKD